MTIYALMIAVADYPEPISKLPGCAEDLKAVSAFFTDYAQMNEVEIKLKTLLDDQATRAGVIEGFKHFDAAGPDDVCILYYSGHGAQMPAPKEFWDQETDRKCETWVLHDSRMPEGRDLADKEISYLLATHAKAAGQVLAISDSCHSGTISRIHKVKPRMTSDANSNVRFEDFLGSESYRAAGEYRHPPVRDHVTLSACRPEQLAMEMPMNGTPHGLFTHHLLATMSSVNLSEISYLELAERVRVRVKNSYSRQDTHAGATGKGDMRQLFLNGELKHNRSLTLDFAKKGGWFVPQGEISGSTVGGKGTILDGETEREITVKRVDGGRSFVNTEDWMNQDQAPYPLTYLDGDTTPLTVYLSGKFPNRTYNALLSNAIEDTNGQVLLTDEPNAAKYHLAYLKDYGAVMTLPGEDRPLFEGEDTKKDGWAGRFVRKIGQVAGYEHVLQLAPATRILDLSGCVEIELQQIATDLYGEEIPNENKEQATDGTAVFAYTRDEEGDLAEPLLRLGVKVKKGKGPLYVGMLYLDEAFSISGTAMPVKRLTDEDESPYLTRLADEDEDGEQTYFNQIELSLPDKLQSWGMTEITNYLKLIVSQSDFTLAEYEQSGLELQEKKDDNNMRGGGVPKVKRKERRDRWGVKDIPFTIYRPLMSGSVAGEDGNPIVSIEQMPEGVTCGEIVLDCSMSNSRSMTETTAPALPTEGFMMEPASMMGSRNVMASQAPLDMVHLTGLNNGELVNADNPMHLKAGDLANTGGLIFAYDEEAKRYYPVGFPDKENNVMVLQQLPPPERKPEEYSRSLGGSVKLFFRKIIVDNIPWLGGSVNKLRMAEVTPEMKVNYLSDNTKKLTDKVVAAEKPIALFIHGIIGDTTTAPAILRRAKFPDQTEAYGAYDLVLTYDYENLKTPLMDTARDLQKQLAEIGLGPNHGKTLHVYSHSMGGLVSRCFIEMLNGKQVVSHLLQFGTPNGGSPYGNVAQWITPLLSRALASGAAYQPYLAPLLGLRWFINNALETLKQMKTGSEFLKMLKEEGDRGTIPYHIINGDIRLIPDVTTEEMNFYHRIVAKLDWRDALDTVFFMAPTDIAVSVKSQQDIPGLHDLPDAIGSDHLSYFINEPAIGVYEGYLPELFNPKE
jgi:pimeloyl-ACP methyl ester carboxylesterase